MDQEKIGRFIQERRKAHALTQEELAGRLGVTNKAVSKWERGKSMPDVALFEPLCAELEVSLAELLAGQRLDGEERQAVTERLLMESISVRQLNGLQILLLWNSVVAALLMVSPFLFRLERPLSLLFWGFGLFEAALNTWFDVSLPGKEARRHSLAAKIVYTAAMFLFLGVTGYPNARRSGASAGSWALIFAIPCLLMIAVYTAVWYVRKRKGARS